MSNRKEAGVQCLRQEAVAQVLNGLQWLINHSAATEPDASDEFIRAMRAEFFNAMMCHAMSLHYEIHRHICDKRERSLSRASLQEAIAQVLNGLQWLIIHSAREQSRV